MIDYEEYKKVECGDDQKITTTQDILEQLRGWIKDCADPDCRNCDGSGIFYGNVCLCGCVNHARPHASQLKEQNNG